jgi:CMP-N,N'-diacetyllegionaminic acid synthase
MSYEGLRLLGLIPARGGSKGLPGKNVRPLCGKPLIAWTAQAAAASAYLDAVVVSTDDDAIAAAAASAGAEVPFMRPEHLAGDDAAMIDVVLHAIDSLAETGRVFDAVVLLQPTSPLRATADIDAAIERLGDDRVRAVVSVCPAEHSPLLAGELPPDGSLSKFLRPTDRTANRQSLPVFHRLNGAVYVARADWLRHERAFLGEGSFAYVMPAERSVDIDSELDFAIAECLLSRAGA